MSNPTALVQNLWSDNWLSSGNYVKQLTLLLSLKMADVQSRLLFRADKPGSPVPSE